MMPWNISAQNEADKQITYANDALKKEQQEAAGVHVSSKIEDTPQGLWESSMFKRTFPDFQRDAENFMADEPEILFTGEYIVDDEFAGALLVWEKYRDATHYEVFKKNLFQSGAEFERILYLDVPSLVEERSNFISYIKKTLEINVDEDNIYVFLDDQVKEDRIYEYEVRAARIPGKADEVDYDLVLRSNDQLNLVDISSGASLFSIAGSYLGSKDLAWIISLLNDKVKFFGKDAHVEDLTALAGSKAIFVPKNFCNIMCLFKESVSLFGLKDSIKHIIEVLGGSMSSFNEALLESIDETASTFSYDEFKRRMRLQAPIFGTLLGITESVDPPPPVVEAVPTATFNVQAKAFGVGETAPVEAPPVVKSPSTSEVAIESLSTLSIVIPTNEGSEEIMSMLGLSRVFTFANDLIIAVLYSQDKKNFERIEEIIAIAEMNRANVPEDIVDEAIKELRDELVTEPDQDTANFLGIQTGEKVDTKIEMSQPASSAWSWSGFLTS